MKCANHGLTADKLISQE